MLVVVGARAVAEVVSEGSELVSAPPGLPSVIDEPRSVVVEPCTVGSLVVLGLPDTAVAGRPPVSMAEATDATMTIRQARLPSTARVLACLDQRFLRSELLWRAGVVRGGSVTVVLLPRWARFECATKSHNVIVRSLRMLVGS